VRHYIRIDPHLTQKKKCYPAGALAAFVTVLCEAEAQPERGFFRNIALLRVLLEKLKRWIPYMIDQGDLIVLPDGRLYVEGWIEWQEGNWKVAERMQRVRERRRLTVQEVTVPTVTAPHESYGGDGNGIVRAVSGKRYAVSGSGESDAESVA
jgi:hypothetical protein